MKKQELKEFIKSNFYLEDYLNEDTFLKFKQYRSNCKCFCVIVEEKDIYIEIYYQNDTWDFSKRSINDIKKICNHIK